MPSFPRVTTPFHIRKWIDVEPGDYDQSCGEVSKKMIRLLRHDKKTEQLNSKFWHRCLPQSSRLLLIGQFKHVKVICNQEAVQEEVSALEENKLSIAGQRVVTKRLRRVRHALYHPSRIDSG